MFNKDASSNYKTLQGWTKSAEYNRTKLQEQVKEPAGGIYKVKMEQSQGWQTMGRPPANGASEWLYLNGNGIPLFYWNKEHAGLTLI